MTKTIEQQAAQTILQREEEIEIGGKRYRMAPPSIATLILVSEEVSRLPHVHLDSERVMEETLGIAKDCSGICEIAAILILGAKGAKEPAQSPSKRIRRIIGRILPASHNKPTETKREALAREIMETATPRELQTLIVQALSKMQVADFFGITTFLTEINLLRPTKVETAATASGR